ncbi:TonB-dependent receptor [Pedobacter sp. SYSU D00535]|uniref:TonB-dependent receptor n=1 Tax=Pedobacter sp. SYSU D00535 TaxID=2810308 RepID=UPI001A97C39F|nr:TonB-dependent receptor [Pedobacter sp. SYSU D00535]
MDFYLQLSIDWRYIMRITLSQLIVLLVLTGISYAAPGKAQGVLNNKVSVDYSSSSLQNVLKELEKAADVKFVYSKNVVDVTQSVSLKAVETKLADVLDNLLLSRGISYELVNDKIILSNSGLDIARADLIVTGRVTDSRGEPLPGVSVKVKGGSQGTSTDVEGNYSIRLLDAQSNATLVFSYLGFVSQEVAINGRTSINVRLAEDVRSLQEVVVVGYGTQKKSDVTGSLTSISAETIQERPVTNVLQAMQGKAAGINVSTNMKPGETPAIRIRGSRSLRASNDPLYVVDGIPIVSALGVTSFSINDINPNDIASIEILKDASATAIYGSRGANGVVLISTKKGSKGRVSVNYNTTVSLDSYKSLTDWMDGGQYIDRWREGLINGRQYNTNIPNNADLTKPAASWYPDPFLDNQRMGLAQDLVAQQSVWSGYEWEQYGVTPKMRPTTAEEQAMGWPAQVPIYNSSNIRSYDWANDAVRQGLTQNHQLSLSSGTDISRMYLSFGYNNQKGVQRDQDFKRYNLSINGDITANKWLTLGTSIIGSYSDQAYGIFGPNTSNTGSKDLYSRALEQFPYALPRDANGAWIRNAGGNLNLWNPLIDIDQSRNDRRSASVMANMFSEVKFTPWLKYRLNFGAQYRSFRTGAWTGPDATNHLTNRPNTAGQNRDENFSWVAENLLYVDKTFGKDHTIGVTLLQSAQKSSREGIGTNVSGTTIPLSLWYDLSSNTVGRPDGYGSSYTENTLFSYMGRLNYTLMNKYLLTASGRFDGSSVLAPGHKWDFFPSFALAWKLKEEEFLQGITWINELKPRLGYGVTGNSSVPPYTTSGPLSRNPYVIGNTPAIGYLPQMVSNPLLGWEKTAAWNLGLDFSVLRSRLSGSVELYDARTYDLLMERPLNPVSGYVAKFENVGRTRNRGIEVTLSSVNIDKKDFSWSTDFNFTRNKEEVVELLNGKEDMIASNLFIGHPQGSFYYYKYDRLWQNTPEDLAEMAKFKTTGNLNYYPGTIKLVDQNGDYKFDGADQVVLGSTVPKWTGGLTNSFRYKNFGLSSFIYARVGQTYFGGYPNSYGGTFPNGRVENDMWSWSNPNGRWPMPLVGPLNSSDARAMQYNDGSFVAVRNISLTYDLPGKLLSRYSFKNVQLNVQVLNPFLFGGEVVSYGINPDDETNWDRISSNGSPLGGTNNNTILPQSIVFGLRAGL